MAEPATMPLAEQQALLLAALAKLRDLQPDTLPTVRAAVRNGVVSSLTYALQDHEDPDTGCLAEPGTECSSVAMARSVMAGELP